MDKTPTTSCNRTRIADGRYPRIPQWRAATSLPGYALSHPLRRWLRYPRSLTAALNAACSGRLTVSLLSQQGAPATLDEAGALATPASGLPMVRQVQLCCDGVPWVFARTVVPRRSLGGATASMLQLGTRPLGAVLFANPAVRRDRLEAARLGPEHSLFRLATVAGVTPVAATGRALWARRCLHHLEAGPLLVTEVFLPTLAGSGLCPPETYGTR